MAEKWTSPCRSVTLWLGDCLDVLPSIADQSIAAVVSDPPYPEIDRDYGRMSEADWHAMMDVVVSETRRVLTPQGSAVFILQPNSEYVGRMRSWLWEFMAKWSREWNQPQDAWWWNNTMLPNGGVNSHGLLRASLKSCVWLGSPQCYREQLSVLLPVSSRHASRMKQYEGVDSVGRTTLPSGNEVDYAKACNAARLRGGTTPFNVITMHHGAGQRSAGAHGHGAGTPMPLAEWWIRYISRPGDLVADWFCGSGTMALAAIRLGRRFVGVEKMPKYFEIAVERCKAELSKTALLDGVPIMDAAAPAASQQELFP